MTDKTTTHNDDDFYENMHLMAGAVTLPDDLCTSETMKNNMYFDDDRKDTARLVNYNGPTLPEDFVPPKSEKKHKTVVLKKAPYL